MKVKLAMYVVGQYDLSIVLQGNVEDISKEYVRITEYAEVEFAELPKEIIIASKVEAIDKLVAETREVAIKEIEKLQQKKQELLALSFDDFKQGEKDEN